MNTLKRLSAAIFMAVFVMCLAVAQTATIKHTVDRGETLASIAKRYSTTEAKIIELNPDAAQFVYVGMELTIPVVKAQEQAQTQTSTAPSYSSSSTYYSDQTNDETKLSSPLGEDGSFSRYGLSYFAPFEAAEHGYYMFGGEYLNLSNGSGWGFDFKCGWNMGLEPKDADSSVLFLVGPSYGCLYNETLVLSSSLDFVGLCTFGSEQKPDGTTKDKTFFGWGISLMPKLTFNLSGSVSTFVGINATWLEDADDISVGFQVGIGFKI